MKEKIKRARNLFNSLSSFISLIEMPFFHWFLFGSKQTIEIDCNKLEEAYLFKGVVSFFSEYVIKNKVYSIIIENHKTNKEIGYTIFLSKSPKLKKRLRTLVNKKDINRKRGLMLSFPACCVDKYCEETQDTGSFESALRFRLECKKLKIPNNFSVSISPIDNVAELPLGFIPCSPLCSRALKILDDYTNIQEAIKNAE